MICGSATFAKQILEVKNILEKAGHVCLSTDDMEHYSENPDAKLSFEEELKLSIQYDVMRQCLKKVAESDAVLFLNYDKNKIKGYLGTSMLMEIGLAYYLDKKIYLLNDIDNAQNYALELAVMKPMILNGDILKIK